MNHPTAQHSIEDLKNIVSIFIISSTYLNTWSGMDAKFVLLHNDNGAAFINNTGALAVFSVVIIAVSDIWEISTSIPKRFISYKTVCGKYF